MKYELEAIITKFNCDLDKVPNMVVESEDESSSKMSNMTVNLRGEPIVSGNNKNEKQKDVEYNLLKEKEGVHIEPVEVTEPYMFNESLTSVLSLLFANRSKATFVIDYKKKEIIAVEIKP